MNKELKKLLDDIKNKKQEVRDLCTVGKIEEAKNAKEELKELQAKFDVLYDLEEEHLKNMESQAKNGGATIVLNKTKDVTAAFVSAIKAAVSKRELDTEDREILNSMNEESDPDGGLTVPRDIRTSIKELRRAEDALENLVNVEHVNTLSGARVIEKYADQIPFDNVDEAAEFSEVSTPQFEKIEYKLKKKGGVLKITQELLNDTSENIMRYLKRWISKKSRATRNFMIIAKIKEITQGEEVTAEGLDDLKKIFNIMLDPTIALTSGVLTNQDGYNWLDTLKDKDGRYILQPDPAKPMSTLLFGRYPVRKVSNRTLPSVKTDSGYKVPIVCGDLKEAITIFDRETLTIDISKVAGSLWETDQTGIKVRERLDIQSIDESAIIMAEHIVAEANAGSSKVKTYTQTELEAMTKANILSLAAKLGYTMTTTESNSKEEIVADFLAQQTKKVN